MSGSSTNSRPIKQWANLLKLLGDIEKQKPTEDDSAESRAKALQNILRDDNFLLYLCKGDVSNFTADMLQKLDPDDINVEFKRSEPEHGSKMKNLRMCETISRKIMESGINVEALKLIRDLDEDIEEKSEDDDKSDEDGMEGIDMHGVDGEADRLRVLIRSLPDKVTLVPESVRELQKPMFATINKFSLLHPPKPLSYQPTYNAQVLKEAAASTNKTEYEVKKEWDSYTTWCKDLQNEYLGIQETIKKNIEGMGILWQGYVPLLEMGDMWCRIKSQSLDPKIFEEAMEQRWLEFQFPKGWISLPPTDDGPFPNAEELRRGVDAREKAQQELNALKGKGKTTDDPSTGSSADSTGAPLPSTSGSTGVPMPPMSAPDQGQVKYKPSATSNQAVPDHNQLAELLARLGISGTGAFPGNQGQRGPGSSSKPKYVVQIVSKRSGQGTILKPNTTADGEPIVAWFVRTRTIKDDLDENKTIQQTHRYFVVQRATESGQIYHETRAAELCGAQRAWAALDQPKVPEVWDTDRILEIPSKRKIDSIDWGIEWMSTRSKFDPTKSMRGIPPLLVCMWWLVTSEDLAAQTDPLRFKKGVPADQTLEQRVVLTRGAFNTVMGKERGDEQICKSMPHPGGKRWAGVEQCIQYYTAEKVLPLPRPMRS